MNNCSLELAVYRSFIETESVSAFVTSLVNGLNEAIGSGAFAIDLTLNHGPLIEYGTCGTSLEEHEIVVPGRFGALLRTTSDSVSKELVSLIKELLTKRVIEHTQYHDRVAESVIRVLGITFHDVRNTLGSISGISQLIEMDAVNNPEVLTGLKDIIGIITKFDESATLSMKLLRGQELMYSHSSFSLTDMCNSVLKRSARVYQLSSISLQSSIQDGVICVGDEVYVKEIFMELLTNAASALEGVGGEMAVSMCQVGGNVEISVGQSGSPVLPEVQEYIFLPFFTTKDKGRGLGLTKTARYLKDWGGRIELLPNADQPVRFVVTLPTTIP